MSAGASSDSDSGAKRLLDVTSNVACAGGSIVHVRRGTMLARPFDARTLQFTGQPVSLVERVDSYAFDSGGYAELPRPMPARSSIAAAFIPIANCGGSIDRACRS